MKKTVYYMILITNNNRSRIENISSGHVLAKDKNDAIGVISNENEWMKSPKKKLIALSYDEDFAKNALGMNYEQLGEYVNKVMDRCIESIETGGML